MRNVLHELFDGKLSRDQMEYEKGKAYSIWSWRYSTWASMW